MVGGICISPVEIFSGACEEEFLWESEMIKIKAADLKSKEVRVNTRLLYQQTKFNLLREEMRAMPSWLPFSVRFLNHQKMHQLQQLELS
ncbi:UNVERIFIED_CONTAM: THO complex subunit, partial [Sesamum calycinum]